MYTLDEKKAWTINVVARHYCLSLENAGKFLIFFQGEVIEDMVAMYLVLTKIVFSLILGGTFEFYLSQKRIRYRNLPGKIIFQMSHADSLNYLMK